MVVLLVDESRYVPRNLDDGTVPDVPSGGDPEPPLVLPGADLKRGSTGDVVRGTARTYDVFYVAGKPFRKAGGEGWPALEARRGRKALVASATDRRLTSNRRRQSASLASCQPPMRRMSALLTCTSTRPRRSRQASAKASGYTPAISGRARNLLV
jgi:hypothetical protein